MKGKIQYLSQEASIDSVLEKRKKYYYLYLFEMFLERTVLHIDAEVL